MSDTPKTPEQKYLSTAQELTEEIVQSLKEHGVDEEHLKKTRLAKEVFSYMIVSKMITNATRESVNEAVNRVLDSKNKKIRLP